jgi:hypothetical protein
VVNSAVVPSLICGRLITGTTQEKSRALPWYWIRMWAVTPSGRIENTICSPDWSMGIAWLQKKPPQARAAPGVASASSSATPADRAVRRVFMGSRRSITRASGVRSEIPRRICRI